MDETGAIRRRDKKIPGASHASIVRESPVRFRVVQWTVSPSRKVWSAKQIPTNSEMQEMLFLYFILYFINNVCSKITKMDVPVERFNGRNV